MHIDIYWHWKGGWIVVSEYIQRTVLLGSYLKHLSHYCHKSLLHTERQDVAAMDFRNMHQFQRIQHQPYCT